MDADSNDFANGLSSVVTRDGQGPATAKVIVNAVGATPYAPAIDPASAVLLLNKATGAHASSIFATSMGLGRWQIQAGDTTAEGGANSGSNFSVYRYNDAGTVIDIPLSIARSTGVVTIANLNVLGGISAPVSATDITASGNLTIGGAADFTSTVTSHVTQGFRNTVAGGVGNEPGMLMTITGVGARQWYSTISTGGSYHIVDLTAGIERFRIDTGGTVTIGGGATITGALIDSTNIQCNVAAGQNALYYGLVAGMRQWYWGVQANAAWIVTDATGGVNRITIDTAGHMTVNGALTCNSNFNTNQINGTAIIASNYLQASAGAASASVFLTTNARQWEIRSSVSDGFLYFFDSSAGALRMYIETGGRVVHNQGIYVTGASTLVGTVTCNAIVCDTINTQNNNITMGTGDITCQNITATGTLSIATFSATTMTVTGNLDVNGTIDVGGNGIEYTALNANRVAFRWVPAPAALTLFANGSSVGTIAVTPSDERLKKNVGKPEGDALADLRAINLISYDMLDEPNHVGVGFSAQQLEGIIPEAVLSGPRYVEDDGETVLSVNTTPLLARCIGAIQQLAARLEALEGAHP